MTDSSVPTTPPEPWYDRADERGLSLEWLAAMTDRSFATVYAYKTGRRRVPAAWLAKVDLLISGRAPVSGSSDKAS